MDLKDKIISELDILRKKETQDKQPFKARAYAKVISELKTLNKPITTMEDIEGIPGIGVKIQAKIKEILESGELLAAKVIREERQFNVMDELITIHGIGPVKAKELVSKYKIKSVDDLRSKFEKDESILNDVQALGLKYHDEISERIPRSEMVKHEQLLLKTIHDVDANFKAMVVGSYRRELATSGDIDVILTLPKETPVKKTGDLFKDVVEKLKETGYIVDILGKGPKKCMAVVRLEGGKARRLDLLLTPEEEYGYALLYFTGSGPFNVVMRQYALEKGYSMNEHTMKVLEDADPKPVDVPSLLHEEDIFKFLGVPFIQPVNRTPEEFERVMKHAKENSPTDTKKSRGRPKKNENKNEN